MIEFPLRLWSGWLSLRRLNMSAFLLSPSLDFWLARISINKRYKDNRGEADMWGNRRRGGGVMKVSKEKRAETKQRWEEGGGRRTGGFRCLLYRLSVLTVCGVPGDWLAVWILLFENYIIKVIDCWLTVPSEDQASRYWLPLVTLAAPLEDGGEVSLRLHCKMFSLCEVTKSLCCNL